MKNKFLYLAILPALVFQMIGAMFYFVILTDSQLSQVIYFATKLLLVIWPILMIIIFKPNFKNLLQGASRKYILTGFISGLLILSISLLAYNISPAFFANLKPALLRKASDLNILENYILFSLFLSVAHSFLEEYYWRWFVLNGFQSKFIASAAFASHHFIVLSQFTSVTYTILGGLAVFVMGYFWSHLYLKSNSIIPGWISHCFADFGVMTVGYFILFT